MARRILVGLTALVLSALPLAASTFVHMSPEELVAGSDAVIRGKIVEVHSFWDAAGTLIHTEALVRVDERMIGEAPGFVTLRTVDRKSTRLNSSHGYISYAVFCLK